MGAVGGGAGCTGIGPVARAISTGAAGDLIRAATRSTAARKAGVPVACTRPRPAVARLCALVRPLTSCSTAAGDVVVWLIIFLIYQQLQDRVIQPLMYRGGALRVNPAVAIVAILVGAELAGVLGALLAIPTAASLGVVIDEFVLSGSPSEPEPEAEAVA